MGWIDEAKNEINAGVNKAILGCMVDASSVREAAEGKTLKAWRVRNCALAAGFAGGVLIPGPGALLALTAEIPLLLRQMSVAAFGTGHIVAGNARNEDYELILAVWSGALKLDDSLRVALTAQIAATGAAVAGSVVASTGSLLAVKAGLKLNSLVVSTALTSMAAKGAAVTVGSKMAAAQIAAKIITTIPGRLIPFVGAGICATVNAVFINSVVDAAQQYYEFAESIPPIPAASGVALAVVN